MQARRGSAEKRGRRQVVSVAVARFPEDTVVLDPPVQRVLHLAEDGLHRSLPADPRRPVAADRSDDDVAMAGQPPLPELVAELDRLRRSAAAGAATSTNVRRAPTRPTWSPCLFTEPSTRDGAGVDRSSPRAARSACSGPCSPVGTMCTRCGGRTIGRARRGGARRCAGVGQRPPSGPGVPAAHRRRHRATPFRRIHTGVYPLCAATPAGCSLATSTGRDGRWTHSPTSMPHATSGSRSRWNVPGPGTVGTSGCSSPGRYPLSPPGGSACTCSARR